MKNNETIKQCNLYMLLITFYSLVFLSFSIYSYSQIDLNLTLSANPLYQSFQKEMIQLGYFNRPLSVAIFVALVFFLYIFYFIILHLANKKILPEKKIYFLIMASIVILFFSYPSFSHDIFNYMFDARIVTKYHENPYIHKALDFPEDNWLRFMHWTHRTYPYGPLWLLATLPLSFLSFGRLTLNLFNFKLMFTLIHIGNIFLIKKILAKIYPKKKVLGIAFYALNPLILIECLISPHNETLMLLFLLLAVYLLFSKRNVLSIVSLFLSIGTKFTTVILLPVFLFSSVIPKLTKKLLQSIPIILEFANSFTWKESFRMNLQDESMRTPSRCFKAYKFKLVDYSSKFVVLSLLLLIIPLTYQIVIREPYPWYFIPFIGIGALLVDFEKIRILLTGTSLAFLLRYAPFLYRGDYSKETYCAQSLLSGVTIVIALLWTMKRRKQVI